MKIEYWDNLNIKQQQQLLSRPVATSGIEVNAVVTDIVAAVKQQGDTALKKYAKQFDNNNLENIAVAAAEFKNAANALSATEKTAITTAIERIKNYHQQTKPQEIIVDSKDGIICKRVPRAIETVGLYVPGGSAPLVSTLMMLALPAMVAGCNNIIVCSPADSNNNINPALLYTAKLCNINNLYKVGGAQAIAAMAYGTETIPQVNKIFGPGNAWVTAAKTYVAQNVAGLAIDMPAGPSEVLVIADESANAKVVAADLLSQAEHGADSQAILVTPSEKLATAVAEAVLQQTNNLSRKAIINKSLQFCRLIVTADLKNAFAISNQYAPEHLIVAIDNAEAYLPQIINAGAVFLGHFTPESMGDYINGSNHVLPTYGYAKSFSGLKTADFMRSISVQQVSVAALKTIGEQAMQLATIEGLDAHKNAIEIRLKIND